MKKHLPTRLLSLLLVVAMLVGFVVPAQAATHTHDHETTAAAESESLTFEKLEESASLDRLHKAEETEEEPLYADTDIVRVSIVLDKESTIESGFSTENIAADAEAVSYRNGLKADQEAMTASIEAVIGEKLDVVWNLTLVANVISANVEYGQIADIEAIEGIKEVFLETRYEPAVVDQDEEVNPNMATSGNQIGSNVAWANGYTGAGSRIAVIDTGIDADHQSMDAAAFEYSLKQNAAAKGMDYDAYVESLDLLDAEEIASVLDQLHLAAAVSAEDLHVNSKIAFGYNYIDEDLDIIHDNDSQGSHGSHVSGIATANTYIPNGDGTFSKAIDTVFVQGVAPDAQLITMKVFGKAGGAYDTDYMVAIEDAITLGCDSVNLSLGSASHGFVTNSGYQELLDSLAKSGTVATISAGNNGSWAEDTKSPTGLPYADDVNFFTGGAPGTVVNSLGVASVQNSGITGIFVKVGGNNIAYNDYTKSGWTNARMTTVAGDQEYVFIDGVGTEADWAAVGDALKGKIAICSRGTTSFFQKGIAAVEAGAIATIIYNNTSGTINMDLTDYTKTAPCVSITQADGALIKSLSTPVTDDEGNVLYYTGKMYVDDKVGTLNGTDTYYTMSSFSSWGTPSALIMKPEITTPGGNIYSINGVDTSGKAYENNSGTSMAAPQAAGMVALVAQYIRETGLDTKTGLSVRQLAQSLLMSTAVPLKEEASDGNYYSVLNQGSGLANVGAAVTANSYIMMNEDATASYADGKVKVELGDDPDRKGEYSFSFSLNNFSENANTYTLSTNIFTQAVTESDGVKYLSRQTTPLAVNVVYTVNGKVFVPGAESTGVQCDLDKDGDTDADDAQIVLNYSVGKITEIDAIADVNGDKLINTYDAHLILSNTGTSSDIVVPAGGKAEIVVKVTLPEAAKAALNETYVNGAYIEGYVFVEPTSSTEGVMADVTHSIPVLGFYGSWTDSSMYEKNTYAERLYGDTTPTYFDPGAQYSGLEDINSLTVKFDGDANTYYMVGNPYFTEETYPADRIAVGSSTTLKSWKVTLLRNAAALATFVTNEAGEVVFVSNPTGNTYGAYYYTSGAVWRNTSTSVGINKPVSKLDVKEGERITVGVVAIPEYYTLGSDKLTAEDVKTLIESGTLGDGAFLTTSMMVDNTAPKLVSAAEDLTTGKLTITAKDENYLAAIRVTNLSGNKVYASINPNQQNKGEEVSAVVDINESKIGRKYLVTVADYAGNMTTYKVTSEREPVDYSGQMFAWTRAGYRRTEEEKAQGLYRWMKIDPDKVWFNTADNSYTGTENVTFTDYASIASGGIADHYVLCGEYVEGFVVFALKDGYIYGAPMEDLNDAIRLASWSEVFKEKGGSGIQNMRLNYADGYMYLLDNQQNFYKFDLKTLELKYAFTVNLTNPNTTSASYNRTHDFAIHKDGTFYALNKGVLSKTLFLYKFSLSDVKEYDNEDGTKFVGIKDLAPIANDKNGYISFGNLYSSAQMFWDHDKEILYMVRNYTTNTTVHKDCILYELNTTTGKASAANSYKPSGSNGVSAQLYNYVYATFVVPSKNITSNVLLPGDTATVVTVTAPRSEVLVTASMQFSSDVGPWNLEDKSVTWRSADESIATIDAQTGIATFHKTGKVTIIATSVAKPNVEGTYEVTVVDYPSTMLSAAVTDSEGNTYMAEFLTGNLSKIDLVTKAPANFLAGDLHEGKVYYHDGQQMYAVDAETHEFTNLGVLASSWQWSDIASAPHYGPEQSFLFDFVVGLSSNGAYLELIEPETGTLRYFDLSGNETFSADPMVAICYAGPYTAKNYPGYTYYVVRESGRVGTLSVYTETEGASFGASVSLDAYTYNTGIDLTGAGTIGSGTYTSAFYDEATGYVMLTQNVTGEPTRLYAIDPNNGVTALIGTFDENITLVNGLYMYDRARELTVRTDVDTLDLYTDETYDITATVLPQGNSQEVTWASSDETIAKVDANGVVTPVGVGTATITVTTVATNDEGKPATATVTVNVKALTSVSVKFNAQITDENGNVYWGEIDTANLSANKIADATTAINAGGWHDGKIYGMDGDYLNGGYMYEIDPANGYTATKGAKYSGSYATVDMASAPLMITDGVKSGYNTALYETCDFALSLTNSNALLLVSDYTDSSATGYNLVSVVRGGTAIAFTGEVIYTPYSSANYLAYEYYILENDGDLHRIIIYPTVSSGKVSYSQKFYQRVANIGEVLNDRGDASMLYVESGETKGLLISYSGNTNSELYFVDLASGEYTTTKIGTIDGVTDLAAIHIPTVTEEEEAIDPAGKMFVWTSNTTARFTAREKINGLKDRWMIVDPATLWLDTDKNSGYAYTGTTNYQRTSYNENKNYVLAAEYVDGKVIFAHYDGYLYSAPITDLNNATQLLYWKDSMTTVNDMALNYQDGYLYVLDKTGTFYKYDVKENTLTKDYTVSSVCPNATSATYLYPYTFAIDDNGNFYAVNYGGTAAKYMYLYTWKLSDVKETTAEDGTVTRAITGLNPINADKDTGYTGVLGRATCHMTWDHDKDILYIMGNGTSTTSGTNGQANTSILYTLDTTTGKAAVCTTYVPEGKEEVTTGVSGLMYNYTRGLFIVPANAPTGTNNSEVKTAEVEMPELDITETTDFVPGTATNVSSEIAISTDISELLPETEVKNVATGSTAAVNTGDAETNALPGSFIYFFSSLLKEEGDVTNGKIVITYDPEVLSFGGWWKAPASSAYYVDETAGTVTMAYAFDSAHTMKDLGHFSFNLINRDAACLYTELKIQVVERNDKVVTDEPVLKPITAGTHDYKVKEVVGDCTKGGYTVYKCANCGYEYTEEFEAGKHNYEKTTVEPTCTEPGYDLYTCSGCGDSYKENEVPAKGHSFGDWETVITPGCETKGQEKRVCSECDEIEYRDTDPAGHNYEKTVTAPTCTEMGYTTYTCSVCQDSYVDDYVKPTGHDYKETVVEPTCTEYGYTKMTCSVCGDNYISSYAPAKGHSFGEWEVVKAATCTEKGQEKRVCSACGKTEYRDVDAKGHTYTKVVTEPTCTAFGYTTYTCSCGDKYVSDYLPAKGHSYNRVVTEPTCTDYGYTTSTCSACGDKYVSDYIPAKGHDYKKSVTAPTCTEMGYTTYTCSVCGDSYKSDYVNATGHTFGDWVVTTPATCTEDGVETRTCVCGETETRAIEATGHAFSDWTVTKAATCTEDGTETRTCACGETETRTIEATGHTFGEWTVTKAATCTEKGEETRTCACGETETRKTDALGHDCTAVTVDPTCTTDGYTEYTCKVCGYSYRDNVVKATVHDYEATVTAPTCTEDGYTTYTCKVCGDSYVADYVDALGHTFGDWTVTKAATCTEDGTETRTCACGETETRTIKATGHNFGDWTVTTEPTCTEKGEETRTCACGETEKREIAALGHDYTVKTVEATCTTDGYTEYTCKTCGYSYRDNVVEAIGHDYEAVVTEATCTEDGYTTYICNNCGDYYVADYVDALGHDFSDWTVVTEATCTADGVRSRTCSACGETEIEVIPAYCPTKDYTDVPLDAWYHEAVDYVVDNGIMEGTEKNVFNPTGITTRAQLVTVLYRLAGTPDVETTDAFTDVPADAWFAKAVAWAYAEGITTGTSATTFSPNAAVTREQVVVFMARYAEYAGIDTASDADLSSYKDAAMVSGYAVPAFAWAVETGIITGVTNDTLVPRGTSTRAQIATILMRFMELYQ